MGFRNLMEEVGLMNDEPTTIYQDNSPAIQILNQRGSLASRSKSMDIRIFKVRSKGVDRRGCFGNDLLQHPVHGC
jgi:hypothetical protein